MDSMTPDAGTPDPTPTPTPDDSTSSAGTGRYCAYDTKRLRFVGPVVDTKAKAKAAAKDRGIPAGDVEVRSV